ncbi:DMT family transporter [Gulosibacter bifidus]|uniref:DMT family transporter n=1 Tax=Gulosibacter bifidus TaxID=272239 RepID=A0ABW5RGP9_9MICO|nr:DMT family transporter [Gulosibacter bifidus]
MHYLGIPIALVGAVLMSLSAYLQHRGVSQANGDAQATGRDSESEGLGGAALLAMLRNPSWLIGTLLIGLAIGMQLFALMFSPLVVVQPLGVVSLVVTTLLTAWQTKMRMRAGKITAVLLCVLGVAAFVTVAAFAANQGPVGDRETINVLIVLAVTLVLAAIAFGLLRRTRWRGFMYIVIGGVLYGFVATLARIVLARFQSGEIGPILYACAIGMVLSLLAGGYMVQSAYASGSTDMVIAGLTVIDPLVAVAIGVVLLNETVGASPLTFALFVIFGAIAVAGVVVLQLHTSDEEVTAARRHAVNKSQ